MDYSHPRHYFLIGVISILFTVAIGFTVQKGIYAGVLGIMIFPMLYFYLMDIKETENRNILLEFLLSLIGLIFIPLAYVVGLSFNWAITTIDILFFGIGFSSMVVATSVLYVIEPDTKGQYFLSIFIGCLIMIALIITIKMVTFGYYLWGLT